MMKSQFLSTTAEVHDPLPGGTVFECDSVDTFCAAMKIGKTACYADIGKGLIKIVKRGKKTLIPPGERAAYLRRLAELDTSSKPAA